MFGVPGHWSTLIVAALWFASGMYKAIRTQYRVYKIVYSIEGKVFRTATKRHIDLRKAQRAGNTGIGMEELFDEIETAGWDPVGEPEEFNAGTYHRITMQIRQKHSLAPAKMITMEFFPEDTSSRRAIR